MASQTAVVAQHATLSGTTADLVTFSATGKRALRVTNHDATVDLYVNVNSSTVPTSSADDTYYVPPGGTVTIVPGGDVLICRLVGNGNVYSAEIARDFPAASGGGGATSIVAEKKSTTGTHATVAASASNVTLIASNTSRLGATIFNDSSSIVYVKLGATATSSSYTVQLAALSYYEVPFGYTGIIDGIWVTATGNARTVELT